MNGTYSAPPQLGRFQQRALIVGTLFWLVFLAGAFLDRAQFLHSFLIGFLFWTGISLGCLALLMLQHLTGGGWGFVIRRVLEAATRTLPLMLVLFVPIVLGAHSIYPWMNHEEMQKSAVLSEKARLYLNLPFFIVRATIYFAVWLTLAYFLNRWSREQDQIAKPELAGRMRMISGPGLALLILMVTFASIDWVMSIDHEWFSTIFGLLFVAAWSVSALSFVIAAMVVLAEQEPMKHVVAPLHFHDLGKLLLALVMLWAYFAFSQYLIIWSGNLPEEISWYLPRTRGGWGAIALVVVLLHFGLPFLFLLSRTSKRDPRKLVLVAGLILIMRFIDLVWIIEPSPHFSGGLLQVRKLWLDALAPAAIGGIWLVVFARQLNKRPLIPFNDPQMESVLEQAHAGH